MKKFLLITLFLYPLSDCMAQNVGIGTKIPQFPLTVKDSTSAGGIGIANVSPNGQVALGTYVDNYGAAFIQTHTDNDLCFATNNGGVALVLKKNTGYFGIGTFTPKARLHVEDSSVVFGGYYSFNPNPSAPPIEGQGKRMMWYAQKSAFRAGYVLDTAWDKDNIGEFSTAFGENTQASGQNSFAAGIDTRALGFNATAFGNLTEARAKFSFALGSNTLAKANYGMALGYYNDTSDNPNPNTIAATDRLLQIGNGNVGVRSNVLTILRNGNMGVGVLAPSAKLEVNGNAVIYGNTTLTGTIKVQGGVPGAGKVLTSDAVGTASWQPTSTPTSISNSGFFAAIDVNKLTGITSGVADTIPFDATSGNTNLSYAFDDGNNFTSGRYTVPTTGFYHFEWSLRFWGNSASQDGLVTVQMKTNTSSTTYWRNNIYNGKTVPACSGSINLKLQAGDKVIFILTQNSGQTQNFFNTADSRLTGYRIY
ncbi:MAG: hypothetical protein JST36_06895 [Bacteroidetes bacterium]|nr:hypothetical protein [Bacteroidota bacterium]